MAAWKNQKVLIVLADAAAVPCPAAGSSGSSRQWSETRKYGVNELSESLSRVPVHRNVLPAIVTIIRATALVADDSCCCNAGLKHAMSTSHAPANPMLLPNARRLRPVALRWESIGNSSRALPGATPAGNSSSMVPVSPSSAGDQ